MQKNTYLFEYDWNTVVKAFWMKYPCPELDLVKWTKVINININEDDSITFHRFVIMKISYSDFHT